MGWTSFNSNLSTKEILIDEFRGVGEIVAMSLHGKENHLAVKLADREDNLVVGFTALVERKDGEVYIKVLDEASFPYYYKASKKVINALSPTENASANAWRAKCLAEKAKQKVVYKPDDVIDLKNEFICNRVKYSSVKLLYPYKNSWIGVGVDSSGNVITPKFKVSKSWIAQYKEDNIHA